MFRSLESRLAPWGVGQLQAVKVGGERLARLLVQSHTVLHSALARWVSTDSPRTLGDFLQVTLEVISVQNSHPLEENKILAGLKKEWMNDFLVEPEV